MNKIKEDRNCMTCKHLKTGKEMLCKKKRKNREIIDTFTTCCKKYDWNEIVTKREKV